MAHGKTTMILRANLLMGVVEVLLLLLALRTGRIEWVAAAVLVAYACAGFVLLPFLRQEFSIGIGDVVNRIWPVIPALGLGWITTELLASSFGNTFFTLGVRGLFTASVVALTHGVLTRFRCFQEARGMIAQNFARVG
jgi:hypothetical protein